MNEEKNERKAEAKKDYKKPSVTKVDLALEETMSKGCKLGTDAGCVGPPIAAFDPGS